MDQEFISQTALDQMVGSDREQLVKAAIPYLPPKSQQILSVYAKTQELLGTLRLFSPGSQAMQACSVPEGDPLDMLNDIRRFCYGESRNQLDQLVNMIAMVQMLRVMKE